MEKLAERRMQREEEATYGGGVGHPSMQGHNHGLPLEEDDGYDDDEDDEYDSQEYDEDDEEDDMVMAGDALIEVDTNSFRGQ